jgi:hypothetical protein
MATAEVAQSGDEVHVTAIRGTLTSDHESLAFSTRVVDFLLRSYVLGEVFPAPVPEGMQVKPVEMGLWCFSCYGNKALMASVEAPRVGISERPMRSHSLLHVAVARGDIREVEKYLEAGMPMDLLAADGLPVLQWSLATKDLSVARYLLGHGCPVDVRSAEGATALMTAIQSGSEEQVNFLLDAGANVNAGDFRGFTALHRAAEMGKRELVSLLLARGAVDIEAQGYTARSLAEKRGEAEIVWLLGTSSG